MDFKVIHEFDAFQELHQEWNQLLTKSASHVPFLRHEFLSSWWQTMGGGEWEEGKLFILTARHNEGQLLGIAPLFLHQETLMFIGSYEISDYLDLIVNPEHLNAFTRELLEVLRDHSSAWRTLDLGNLREDSPSPRFLEKHARELGWTYHKEVMQPAPCLSLPSSWEEYLDRLDSKHQHEIERKVRRAQDYFLPVDWYIVKHESQLDGEIDSFLELMAYHPEKAQFLTDVMASQFRKSVHQAFHEGWVHLSFLTVGGKKAAGYLNFDYNNRLWVYNSGLNPMFENISPGWVLLSYLIQWGIEQGREYLDFLRGDEAYKYHFGGEDQYVVKVQIKPDPS